MIHLNARSGLCALAGILCLAAIAWIGFFAVGDSDFWWHVRAGEVMWNSMHLIATDPFAYTREGLPYLATHEWLAQLILAGTYNLGGATGIFLLRILCIALVAGFLLLIDRKRLWPHALLLPFAFIVMRQGFIERPQLFSLVFFAASLFVCIKLLETEDLRRQKTLLLSLIGIEVVWVNLHGAAAMLAILLAIAVGIQKWLEGGLNRNTHRLFHLGFAGLFIGLLLSPNHYHNLTYVFLLFSDKTATLIAEWSPHAWPQYLTQIGPFWILALATIFWTRKHLIFSLLTLLALGYLSRSASRHEALLLIALLGITFYQLKHNTTWNEWVETLTGRFWLASGLGTILLIPLFLWIDAPYHAFLKRENLLGIGTSAPGAAAADFLEKNKIQGKIFNTYSLGGYFLYRDHKVFIDGRNNDYGFDFMSKALAAREDETVFRDLEKKYGFTTGVIEYAPDRTAGAPTDFTYLDRITDWHLAFIDDWVAVYVKDNPTSYNVLTPRLLLGIQTVENLTPMERSAFETELRIQTKEDRSGILGRMLLAKLLRDQGKFDEAASLLLEAIDRSPARHEPYQLLASVRASQGTWEEAGLLLEKVVALTRYLPVEHNYALIGEMFERAGFGEKARRYREMAD